MKRLLFLFSLLLLLAACSSLPIETNMSQDVQDFSFTNQDEEAVDLDDLKGQWWIADFVFTNCTTVCLPMTSNMKHLQENIASKGLPVQLVSFSVDPDYDTPEVLKNYGEDYDADFDSWHFLTGYDFDTIRKLSIKSFKAIVKEPEYGDDQVMHDTRFFLVNPEGEIVKGYDGVKGASMDDIMADLNTLNQKNKL